MTTHDFDNNNYNPALKLLARDLRHTMTKAEACLWKYVLRNRKMKGYQFNRQRPVLKYIADFRCKELKLIIEVDGYTHQWDETIIYDEKRQNDLEKAGYTVMRFTDNEILKDINNVIFRIESWIEENGKGNHKASGRFRGNVEVTHDKECPPREGAGGGK